MPFSMFRGRANQYLPIDPNGRSLPMKWILIQSTIPDDIAVWAWGVQNAILSGTPVPVHSVRTRGHMLAYTMSGPSGHLNLFYWGTGSEPVGYLSYTVPDQNALPGPGMST